MTFEYGIPTKQKSLQYKMLRPEVFYLAKWGCWKNKFELLEFQFFVRA